VLRRPVMWPYQAPTAIYRAENADMALVRLEEVEPERGKHRGRDGGGGTCRPAFSRDGALKIATGITGTVDESLGAVKLGA
jgi:hypothetical protein